MSRIKIQPVCALRGGVSAWDDGVHANRPVSGIDPAQRSMWRIETRRQASIRDMAAVLSKSWIVQTGDGDHPPSGSWRGSIPI